MLFRSIEGGPPLLAEIEKIVEERVKKIDDKMQEQKKETPSKKEKEVPKP